MRVENGGSNADPGFCRHSIQATLVVPIHHSTNPVMARVSLIEENDHPDLAELIGKIRAGRRGAMINVYKLLLHAPPLAAIWLDFVSAARFKTELDGRLREIVIVRVAHLNRTTYVFKQHVPQLSAPEGLTDAECDALADWQNAKSFNARERAALAYTDAMTRDIAVADEVFNALKPHFNERQIVELSVLIGLYNMHTRVFTALGIDAEPHHR
jgi:4-carboxymuconolactone decarboxylase